MALSAAFTNFIVLMALIAAFPYQMSAADDKHPVTPPSLDPPQVDLYPPNNPYMATIKSITKFTDETCNVVIEHDGNVPAWEGQVYGLVKPGTDVAKYFMLASTRYGDYFNGKTANLCVRVVGPTSHYLCNAEPGSTVGLAGPYYRNMLLPQDNPNATQIMVASDTGIAPFRGYLRRMFVEDVPYNFTGTARLFYGANDTDSVFYDNELSQYAEKYSENFAYENATDGQEGVYAVQVLISKNISEIYSELKNKCAYISFCGLQSMMPGIRTIFENEARRVGDIWDDVYAGFLVTKQWREITWEYNAYHQKMMPETYNILGRKAAKTGGDGTAKMKLPPHEATIYDNGEPERYFYFV